MCVRTPFVGSMAGKDVSDRREKTLFVGRGDAAAADATGGRQVQAKALGQLPLRLGVEGGALQGRKRTRHTKI